MKRSLLFLLLIGFFATLLAVPPAAAQMEYDDDPWALPPALAQEPLDCTNSPFGRAIILGSEQEIFVGMRGAGAGRQGWVLHDQFDLNPDGTALIRDGSWPATDETPNANAQNVSALASTTGKFRFESDRTQLVQVYTGADGTVRWLVHEEGQPVLERSLLVSNYALLQVASGVLSRAPGRTERLALASRTAIGSLNVFIIEPLRDSQVALATWRTDQDGRKDVVDLQLAVGDLNGDGFNDEIILGLKKVDGEVEVIVLRYDPDYTGPDGGPNFKSRLREVANFTLNTGTPTLIRVAAADLDGRLTTGPGASQGSGDYKDEIILLTDTDQPDVRPLSPQYTVQTFALNASAENPEVEQIVQRGSSTVVVTLTSNLTLATGDLDGSGRAEILVGEVTPDDVAVRAFDGATGTPRELDRFALPMTPSPGLPLAVAAGDLDRDGLHEVGLALLNNQALQVTTLAYQPDTTTLSERDTVTANDGGRQNATSIDLAFGDWNDDSLKALYGEPQGSSITCKTVQEPNIVSVVHAPPYWQRLQGNRLRLASIGQSTSFAQTDERALTVSSSHAVSAYFGGGFEADFIFAKVAATARVTAGYQYTGSVTNRGGTTEGKTTREAWTNDAGSFAAIERTTYDCYNYRVVQDGQELDAGMRFCEYKDYASIATDVGRWNSLFGPANNPQALQWIPLNRDWANLALFRRATVAQSSTVGDAVAARAIDGIIDPAFANGSVTQTEAEDAPWWQVDLGLTQELGAVRVWNRNNLGCDDLTCAAQLRNFYVFVSDTDLRTISNDPAVLKDDPRVATFFSEGQGGRVTNIQTYRNNAPIFGRYVRVQLAGTGYLALAEVQVFGERQVDPDRYPINVSDSDPNDGYFTVSLYNPLTGGIEQVRQRGRLLWNGANYGVLAARRISVGNPVSSWSLTEERTTFTTQADATSHSVSIGAEFDAEVSAGGGKVVFGGGYEYTSGVITEDVRSTAWGTSFELGGGVQGFPATVGGVALGPGQCEYGFQPYYYEVTEESSTGFLHRFIVVDYTVPNASLNRNNLAFCRQPTANQPIVEADINTVAPGSSLILTARGFTDNSENLIELRYPGQENFRQVARIRMSSIGELVFVLATSPNDPPGDYAVRIRSVAQGTNLAQAQEATTAFTLSTDAALVEPAPPGVPVFSLQPRLYLPLISR
ncbi:hypothetical protein [Candidatus Chloroploca sp. Khr17]|uniref:galactose-binding domain-containing protein n=1 Tax=Candidatus Chloroploca sp. Khr17 TaxID=2496869 RepID=UPI00101DD619|nr:hypothetical protein [Candidatus Chloroploca sp. Khr17]